MKLGIRDLEVGGKRVLVRVDFNVPTTERDGKIAITDDTRAIEIYQRQISELEGEAQKSESIGLTRQGKAKRKRLVHIEDGLQRAREFKTKAEEELRENFKPIFERRMIILETILDIKTKIQSDVNKMRKK